VEAVRWDLSSLQGEDVIEEEVEDGQHHTGNEVLHFYSVFEFFAGQLAERGGGVEAGCYPLVPCELTARWSLPWLGGGRMGGGG
jgi:hypothetical protein